MSVIAAVDQSEQTEPIVEHAQQLASAFGVELHVVHVGSRTGATATQEGGEFAAEANAARERAETVAEKAIDHIEETANCRTVGLVGDPAQRIVEYGTNNDAKYIVVGGRKRTPVGKALFGSTTQSILLNAACSVVTVPRKSE